MLKRCIVPVSVGILLLLLTGCGGGATTVSMSPTLASTSMARAVATLPPRTAPPAPAAMMPTSGPGKSAGSTPVAAIPTSGAVGSPPAPAAAAPAEIKAGEVDDNKLWDDYLLYRIKAAKKGFVFHNVDVSERYVISATTKDQAPILGARVRIYSGQTLVSDTYTYANGQTLFFPKASQDAAGSHSFDVVVEKDGVSSKFTLNRQEKYTWAVTLDGVTPSADRPKLDVVFLLDATGSMGDEIAQLQSNILAISSKINALPGQPDVRYGMVTYRDRGDEYVTRIYQFTPNVQKFQTDLSQVMAGGGGDNPESLNAGLHDAVNGLEWRGSDTIKLVFLVADAPPHLDYADDYDYAQEMVQATRRGIKIFSLAASGLDDQGEYIFRQMAEYTMGHFIFITYADQGGNGGAPGENTNKNVSKDDYSVELLDQLVLRLIKTELAYQNTSS